MIFHNFLCYKFCLKIIKKIIKLCRSKISTCVKYSIDAYHRYILRRYILPSCFGNLNSRACQGDSLNAMFPRFLNCFQPFPLAFPHVSPGVSTFPHMFFPFPILDFSVVSVHYIKIYAKGVLKKWFCLYRNFRNVNSLYQLRSKPLIHQKLEKYLIIFFPVSVMLL